MQGLAPHLEALCREIECGCGAVIVAAELLTSVTVPRLGEIVRQQPPWSDLPFLVVTHAEPGRSGQLGSLQVLGNVTVLPRPLSRDALLSAVQTALRARRRQYQIRNLVAELNELVEQLQEASRRKDEFLAMLAHELRNPLAPIRNAVEILKRVGPMEPRVVRARDIIDRQVAQQAHLLDDLLEVSRITRGKIRLRCAPLDLNRLVRDTAEDHRSLMEEAGLTLELALPNEPVWVEGDATRLAQVFSNLLQNAAKFTEAGGRVTVGLSADESRQWAMATVTDTGIGIEPEVLPTIFETFVQADKTLDRSRGGLGLGLALVEGLTQLHGGTARAESQGPGHGATFRIRLPLLDDAQEWEGSPTQPFDSQSPLRVLIVEDNRDTAQSMQELLELSGCIVQVAYSGPMALAAAPKFRPEVVLCDIGLPRMDGYEVARQLRREPVTARARLVAVTGYGGDEARSRSREAGFELHMTKPLDFADLQRILAFSPEHGYA